MLSHLVLTTFINPEDRDLGQVFELRCMKLRMACRFLELEEHEHLAHPTHMIPWFLMDLIGDVEPHNLLYLHPAIKPTEKLIRRALGMEPMDIGVVKRYGKPNLEAMYLLNNDMSRGMLDTWIMVNDELPWASAEGNLPEVVRRHRTKAVIRDMAKPLLSGIHVPKRIRMAQIGIIQDILNELKRLKKSREWLAAEVANRIDKDRPRPNRETILRMLRSDTEGGVYLIDGCLDVLEMVIVQSN